VAILTEREPLTSPEEEPGVGGEAAPRRLKFPTALTVLAIVLMGVWVASFFIPSGVYDIDPETGGPIPGTYTELPSCGDVGAGELCSDKGLVTQFKRLWDAPPSGLYGIESETGFVGGDESGFLYGSAKIFLFVLAIGAFVTITMKTGAIETGIGRLAMRFRHTPAVLVASLMGVFALGGTTYGMWEETLGFFALLVPLALALRYDRLVAVSIVLLGAGTGVLASTVNPFATGVASDAAGIGITDGIGLRIAMWLVLVPTAIAYVLWYGSRVRRDASSSIMSSTADEAVPDVVEVAPLTGRQQLVLGVFFAAFAVMIYGFVPWNDIWDTVFSADFPLRTFDSFYFAEATVLFIVAAVVIGIVGGLGEEGTVTTMVSGASEYLGAALVIVLARATTVVMKNTHITDTILHWMEDAVSGNSNVAFAWLAFVVNLPIAFLVPSSSGHAALVMPILGPLSIFADIEQSLSVTAYQSASGFINYITPTSAVVMGGLVLAKVGYHQYLRFVAPFLAIAFVIISAFMAVGVALG
jgi:uncharacterized ion transporter superfamily protein YfcC